MIFRRLIAFPESRRVLWIHVLATPFLALQSALMAMVPVLLRDYFQANAWQTAVCTSAIPIMHFLSVFWNELYRRMPPAWYLLTLWAVTFIPLAAVAGCRQPETALVLVVISAIGFGAMTPLTADILRSCYPPGVRSRVFGILQVTARCTIMLATFGIGVWLEIDHQAFRTYLPAGSIVVGLGMYGLARIAHQPLFRERHRVQASQPLWISLQRAVHNMIATLARDREFRRYETAFFIYGVGWMIGNALLPFLVVDELNLTYDQIAVSTQTVMELVLLVTMIPTSYLMDRLGPIRMASWAFAVLIFYPIGLIIADGPVGLAVATACFALGISGVQLAWTIGPVTLARDSSHAPHYLAIHATLVGCRAILGQFPAVALYKLVGIETPLVLASILFAIGAILMRRLDRDHRLAGTPSSVILLPPPHARVP